MNRVKFGLSRKIFLMLVGILLIPLGANIGSLVILTNTAQKYKDIIEIDTLVALRSKDMERQSLSIQNTLLFFAVNIDAMVERQYYRENLVQDSENVILMAEELRPVLEESKFSEKGLPLLEEAISEFNRFRKNSQERMLDLETNIRAADDNAVGRAFVALRHYSIEEPLGNFIGDIKAIQTLSSKSVEQSMKDLDKSTQISIGLIFGSLVLSVLLSIIIISVFTVSLKRVLIHITQQIYDISQGQGDLTHRINLPSNDELGQIARYLNDFLDTLNSLIVKIKTITLESSSLSDELAESSRVSSRSVADINQRMDDIKTISDSLDNNIEQINSIFSKVQNFISQVDKSITIQSNQIIKSSTLIDEMRKSIDELSAESSKKVLVANALREKAKNGETQMEMTTAAINDIEASTNLIIDMLEVINNIASQTGLLAMNAAIEAAHAGDAGRGFSVVADEIQKLSVETAENSGNITSEMEGIISHIRKSVVYSKETSTIFKQIVDEVEEVTTGFREMNYATTDLSTGSQLISGSISSLVESSNDLTTAAGSMDTQILEVSESLKNLKTQSLNTNSGMEEITKTLGIIGTAIDGVRETGIHNVKNIQELESLVDNFVVSEDGKENPE